MDLTGKIDRIEKKIVPAKKEHCIVVHLAEGETDEEAKEKYYKGNKIGPKDTVYLIKHSIPECKPCPLND